MKAGRVLFHICLTTLAFGSGWGSEHEPAQNQPDQSRPNQDKPNRGRPDFDARRLLTGTFHYRDYIGEKSEGESVIQVQKMPGGAAYAFSNLVSGSLSQHWRAVVATDFTPLSAELTFGNDSASRKAFSLSYQAARVTGFFLPEPRAANPVSRPVNETVARDTVDQRVDWAAVMSFNPYVPSQQFFFHVYDPKAGNSQVTATVKSLETIHVSAGTFHVARIAYRIDKATGSETFEVFVKDASPRFLVKEVFPDGVISELASKES